MSFPRIVITGIGVLTSNASTTKDFAAALRAGKSGIRDITRFNPGFGFRQGGEINLPAATDGLDRVSQLAVAAAEQALLDGGLDPEGSWREEIGLCVGTSRGPALSLEKWISSNDAECRRKLAAEVPFFSIARNIASRLELSGPVSTVTMACVSSSLAIGRAFDAIRRGRARLMLAGGADALTNLSFSGFSLLRAMTRTVCRPFDRRRDGIVLGEGAGLLLLEELEHARRRGARIYAELCGWASAGDAYHATSPHPDGRGLSAAIAAALRASSMNTEQVDGVNLHGTGTAANDPAECNALLRVFGTRCERLPINSLKSMIGHTLGASGVLELAGSILGMVGGFIPATLNCEEPDPRCKADIVLGECREQKMNVLLSTKSAFGGANVAIVAKRSPDITRGYA